MNGSIHKIDHGKYRVRWREPDGRARSKTLYNHDEAKRLLNEVRTATGRLLAPLPPVVTLRAFHQQWWATKQLELRPKTRADYESLLRNHVSDELWATPLQHLRASALQDAFSRVFAMGQVSTARKLRAVLSAALRAAVDDGLIATNPVSRTKVKGGSAPRWRSCPTPAQVMKLADACPPWAAGIVLIAGFGGLRWGEIGALEPEDLDLDRCEVTVSKALEPLSRAIGPPKTTNGYRTAPFDRHISHRLEHHLEAFSTGSLAFPSPTGEVLHHSNFRRRVWVPACEAVGPRFRFHDLRHTYATSLISAGAPPQLVAVAMGHGSAALTLDVYSGLWPHQRESLRSSLARSSH